MKATRLITGPTIEPVSLADFKLHARIDGTDEDAILPLYIRAARSECEQRLGGRSLLTQTWETVLDRWPDDDDISLDWGPVQSITSVNYRDTAGSLQTVPGSVYALDSVGNPAWVVLQPGQSWPIAGDFANAIAVRYVTGVATAAEVPDDLKAWILLAAAHLYAQRERTAEARVPSTFHDSLLDRWVQY